MTKKVFRRFLVAEAVNDDRRPAPLEVSGMVTGGGAPRCLTPAYHRIVAGTQGTLVNVLPRTETGDTTSIKHSVSDLSRNLDLGRFQRYAGLSNSVSAHSWSLGVPWRRFRPSFLAPIAGGKRPVISGGPLGAPAF